MEPESSPPRLTPARPGRVFGTGGCRSPGAARGCSGSKDQARPGRLEPAGPANRGPAGASPADWAPRGPAPSRPRPSPGLLEPHPLRPGLRGRAARGRGRSPQSCPPAGTGVGGRGRSLGWGKTPGRWAGRRDKLGHWKTDWSSFFATTPAALRGSLASPSLSVSLSLSFSPITPATQVRSTHRPQVSGLDGTAATAGTSMRGAREHKRLGGKR